MIRNDYLRFFNAMAETMSAKANYEARIRECERKQQNETIEGLAPELKKIKQDIHDRSDHGSFLNLNAAANVRAARAEICASDVVASGGVVLVEQVRVVAQLRRFRCVPTSYFSADHRPHQSPYDENSRW